ncbi:MAG: HAMP domain-containing protein [Actinobacteria bacterium]|nr:HAMP domain-containing protein [Actinomycetota bacterium]MCA1737691.1 HAMP domain-containing protein [Actinomycetota bacterium]
MGLRFRVLLPVAAVLLVLLSIGALLLYVLPTARSRLSGYAEDRAMTQAAAAASTASEAEESDLQRELEATAAAGVGEVMVVDQQGNIEARAGERLLSSPPEDLLQRVADGERINEMVGEQRVAAVPVVRGDGLAGGAIFAPEDSENSLYQIFLRSGIEAAGIASVLGGGFALLLATLLSRRVERLTLGARSIEQGDFSSRIEPDFDDELGELAMSFNAMAAKLEDSFAQIEEKSTTLDAILNSLDEGVLATDLKGNMMFANHSARSMLGLEREQPSGKLPNPWKDFDLPEAVVRCANYQECGEARVQGEKTFLQIKLEHMSAFDNHKGGVLVVSQDLSEGRRLEANQQRFLANAAHELKTPLTTILGAAELLLTGDEEDPELRRRFLNHIHSEAHRMQQLSDTLLQLARTGFDLREPNPETLNLDAVARRMAERVEPLAENAGLELSFEGQGTRVCADAEWLEQALLVLLSNAIKHSSRDKRVWLRMSGGAVEVEDEGSGISEADLPYVFERFYQGEGSSGGFGLGLSICKELVERMEGKISVNSQEGVGTAVKIELPEVEADA